MKALVLGASGFFGNATAHRLGNGRIFSELLIASRSADKAERLASEIGAIAKPLIVDIADQQALLAAVSNADVVVNASGPALETSIPAMHAALRARKHYCYISAETGVLLKAEAFTNDVTAAGLSFVLGAGLHPGMLDMLGEFACRKLDEVESVNLFAVGALADYAVPEAMIAAADSGWNGSEGIKTIFVASGTPVTRIVNGQRETVVPGSTILPQTTPDHFDLEFIQWATFEALALHRRRPKLHTAAVYFGLWPRAAQGILLRDGPAFVRGEKPAREIIKALFGELNKDPSPPPRIQFWAEATGRKNGAAKAYCAYSNQDWASNRAAIATTSSALAFAAEALANDEVTDKGVLTCADADVAPSAALEMR